MAITVYGQTPGPEHLPFSGLLCEACFGIVLQGEPHPTFIEMESQLCVCCQKQEERLAFVRFDTDTMSLIEIYAQTLEST